MCARLMNQMKSPNITPTSHFPYLLVTNSFTDFAPNSFPSPTTAALALGLRTLRLHQYGNFSEIASSPITELENIMIITWRNLFVLHCSSWLVPKSKKRGWWSSLSSLWGCFGRDKKKKNRKDHFVGGETLRK